MTKKITQLPSATLITGRETLPLVQSGRNVSAGVGVSQVPQVFGDLPTTSNIGTLAYIPDAVGGARLAYWDGTQWKTFGGVNATMKVMGAGVWVIGIEASFGVAAAAGYDGIGAYFLSLDGVNWFFRTNTNIKGGIHGVSYANGCFLMIGLSSFAPLRSAIVATSTNPITPTGADAWNATPPLGWNLPVVGSDPEDPIAYDNPTGVFTVPITGVGNVDIINQLPSAVTPDPTWPHVGRNAGQEPVLGVGTSGPMEVGVFSTLVSTPTGRWPTNYVVYRRPATSDWSSVANFGGTIGGIPVQDFLSASPSVGGLQLRGLVWGPIKETAVQFAPGSN